ncbi:MAG: peptidase T [Oscillospiraceae bacterium]|nr:peptidase T [Oscillospiraceae bacterium]
MMDHSEFHRQTEARLLRYAAVTTQSKRFDGNWPTTACQRDLAKLLFRELQELGIRADYDETHCVVYGWLPAVRVTEDRPIALVAHIDTAPDVKGWDVKPWVLRAYPGGDIVLNEAEGIVMHAADYLNLAQYIGQDLVLTDGTTLLGGDDKAAIAAVMTLAEYYAKHPEQPHRTICIAFTPDEEVGGLAKDLDLERLGAKFAYTIDGDHLGWYQDQTFNACEANVTITGRSVHPATAKGIMVNASDLAAEFLSALPPLEKPQFTDGVDGFYYVTSVQSNCELARIHMIVRDFDREQFQRRQKKLLEIAQDINARCGQERVLVEIHQQYRNMGDVLEQYPFLVSDLEAAIRAAGLEPKSEPFRGGTDGSALSFRGLPSPNLSAGYENAHGRFEFVPVPSMAKNVEILLRLTEK